MNACGESAATDARIITPAFTHELIPCGIDATRDDRAVAVQRGERAVERVGGAPEVGPGAGDGEGAAVVGRLACDRHCADVAVGPALRQSRGRRTLAAP